MGSRVEIWQGPPGVEVERAFIEKVIRPLRRGNPGVVWLVPGSARVSDLARRTAAQLGQPASSRWFSTLQALAARLWPRHPDYRPLATRAQRRLLLRASFAERARGRTELEALHDQAGFLDHLARLFDEIGHLDVRPLQGVLRELWRAEDLREIFADFRGRLRRVGVATLGEAYHRLADRIDSHGLLEEGTLTLLVIDGLYQPSHAEGRLLRALSGRAEATRLLLWGASDPTTKEPLVDIYGSLRALFAPRDLFEAGPRLRTWAPRVCTATEVARRFGRMEEEPIAADDHLSTFSRHTPSAEVECIADLIRDLASSKEDGATDLSTIAVCFPNLDAYAPIVRDVFSRWGIPYDMERGYSLLGNGLVRASLALLEIPASGFERVAVERALSSPYVRFRGAGGDLAPGRIDRIAREALVVGGGAAGRREWRERLLRWRGELAASLDSVERSSDRGPASARRWREMIRTIDDQGPVLEEAFDVLETLSEPAPPPVLAQRTIALFERFEVYRCAAAGLRVAEDVASRDLSAWTRFTERIRETGQILREAGERSVTLTGFVRALRLTLLGETFMSPPPRTGGRVRVMRLLDLRGVTPTHLFVGGLTMAALSAEAAPRLFLGEAQRRRAGLRTIADANRQLQHLLGLALTAPRTIVLSHPGSPDGRAPLVSEVHRLVTALSEARPSGRLRSERDRQIAVGSAPAPRAKLASAAGAQHLATAVARAMASDRAREGRLSAYDGLLGAEAAAWLAASTLGPEHVFSASQLERYASCPFRFFAERVLRLAPLPEPDLDLDPLTRGGIVHEMLRLLGAGERERGQEPGPGWVEGAVRRLASSAEALLSDRIRRRDLFSQRFADGLMRGLDGRGRLGVVRRLVEAEAERGGTFSGGFFEAAFGRSPAGGDQLSSKPLTLGDDIQICGAIDRIEVNPSGTEFLVFDYKTGSVLPMASDLREGVRLQLAVYLVAAAHFLGGPRAEGAAYYVVREGPALGPDRWLRSRPDRRLDLPDDLHDALTRVPAALRNIVESARAGRFHPGHLPPLRKGCAHCDYQRLCRVDHARMEHLAREDDASLFRPLPLWEKR